MGVAPRGAGVKGERPWGGANHRGLSCCLLTARSAAHEPHERPWSATGWGGSKMCRKNRNMEGCETFSVEQIVSRGLVPIVGDCVSY